MSAWNIISLIGGLGLLLFGIKTLGEGLEAAAGQKMKRLMETLTRNKLMCVLVGAFVTAAIQSSTATTLMVVGFVNANLLTLSRAIGVIMGANIGTTLTSLILSVNLDFGALFTAIAAILLLIGKKPELKLAAKITIGLGLLFVGMATMKNSMLPLTEWEGFRKMILLASNPILGALVGAVITALLHSSAASVGILQALAASGAISLQASLFILFGTNIGTCVTALVSSVSANHTARRTAIVHLLFNLIGTIIFIVIALLLPLDKWIVSIAGANNFALQVAVAHIVFNLTTTLILLPLSNLLEKLACLIVPGEDPDVESMRMKFFDKRFLSTPSVAVSQLFKEVNRMGDIVMKNYQFAIQYIRNPEEDDLSEFNNNEDVIDFLNAEITQNLIDLHTMNLSVKDNCLAGSLFHVVNDLERIGDHATNLVEIGKKKAEDDTPFSPGAIKEIDLLTMMVTQTLEKSIRIVKEQISAPDAINEVERMEEEVDILSKKLADRHMQRLTDKECSPRNGKIFLDILNNMERISDHADNLSISVDTGNRKQPVMLW